MSDTESKLAGVVNRILESYDERGNINHLDGSNLPSRAEVSVVLDDLFALIFPGFFDSNPLDELTARYYVGDRCVRCLRALEHMIARVAASPLERNPTPTPCAPQRQALALMEAIPDIRRTLDTDVKAALDGDPAARSAAQVIASYPGIRAIAAHRIAHALYRLQVPLLPRMLSELVHSRTGIDIHPGARIDHSFFIDHGTGVVVGETCVIGHHVKLYQGVTLGALSIDPQSIRDSSHEKRHPTLEDHVTVYAGATILGGDTLIGRGSVVGGNVWLTRSVSSCSKVVATPPSAKIIPRNTRDGPCSRDDEQQ